MNGVLAPDPARDDPLVDAFVDSYVEWREECNGVRDAYGRWAAGSGARDRRLGEATYRAALDREEAAARVHEQHATRLARHVARLARRNRRWQRWLPRPSAWPLRGSHAGQTR
jgi:hypothetical protein